MLKFETCTRCDQFTSWLNQFILPLQILNRQQSHWGCRTEGRGLWFKWKRFDSGRKSHTVNFQHKSHCVAAPLNMAQNEQQKKSLNSVAREQNQRVSGRLWCFKYDCCCKEALNSWLRLTHGLSDEPSQSTQFMTELKEFCECLSPKNLKWDERTDQRTNRKTSGHHFCWHEAQSVFDHMLIKFWSFMLFSFNETRSFK